MVSDANAEDSLIYFAYGSNMSAPRLRARVGSARRIGIATLESHRLVFHKVSDRDGSGKGDIVECDINHVMGVLFDLDKEAKRALDEHEGLGYEAIRVTVNDGQGTRVAAVAYRATVTDPGLKPFTWYLRHVMEGARQAGLPGHYRRMLSRIDAVEDPDAARAQRELAIYR